MEKMIFSVSKLKMRIRMNVKYPTDLGSKFGQVQAP